MSSLRIADVQAWVARNSQGEATVACRVILEGGENGVALVPSGTSRGRHEAREMVDDEAPGWSGRGMARAVEAVTGLLRSAVIGLPAAEQRLIDATVVQVDGTPDKSRLGANALLAISLAAAQAAARGRRMPLWQHIGSLTGTNRPGLPRPMISIFSGGLHAPGGHPIQDFLVIPLATETLSDTLAVATAVRRRSIELVERQQGAAARLAPSGALFNCLATARDTLVLLNEASRLAGFAPGADVGFAIDLAASGLAATRGYVLDPGGPCLTSTELIETLEGWVTQYGVVTLEDPLDDDDWADWSSLTHRLGNRCQIVGDDLFTTSAARLKEGVTNGAANAVLLKPSQCGTLTELLDVAAEAKRAGYGTVVSQRSVETEDTFIADLAVGCAADESKFGPLVHSERLAKYNRLLELEATTDLRLAPWPARAPITSSFHPVPEAL